jgi:hypothetical protein
MITPVPLHSGQVLSRAATTAARMNSDLLGIPFMASRRDSGTLNVIMSSFSFFIGSFPRNMDNFPTMQLLLCNTDLSRESDCNTDLQERGCRRGGHLTGVLSVIVLAVWRIIVDDEVEISDCFKQNGL